MPKNAEREFKINDLIDSIDLLEPATTRQWSTNTIFEKIADQTAIIDAQYGCPELFLI